MDDATKQAILSAIRSLLAIAGGALAAHGVINEAIVNEVIGAVMTVIPIAWGIWDKYNAERKTAVREVAAVNAGIAAQSSGTVGETARPADVPQIIKDFAPSSTKET